MMPVVRSDLRDVERKKCAFVSIRELHRQVVNAFTKPNRGFTIRGAMRESQVVPDGHDLRSTLVVDRRHAVIGVREPAEPTDYANSASRSYSHSIVAGGLLVMSYTTRLMPSTSFTIRLLIRASTSYGRRAQSAVIAS